MASQLQQRIFTAVIVTMNGSLPILRSFLRQLYLLVDSPNPVTKLYEEREKDGFSREDLYLQEVLELIQQLLIILRSKGRTFIILDGLDECDTLSRVEILEAFQGIVSNPNLWVKFLIASRDDGEISFRLENCPNVSIHCTDTSSDIKAFVIYEVQKAIDRKRLLRGQVSKGLQEKIISTLVHGANGM